MEKKKKCYGKGVDRVKIFRRVVHHGGKFRKPGNSQVWGDPPRGEDKGEK